jgi:hypothetical protein
VPVDDYEPDEGYADDDGLTLDEEEMIEEVA